MSDINKWEKNFRTAAHQHDVRPPAIVWDKIATELDKKRKRRVIIWFFSGLLAVGLTAGIYILSDQGVSESKVIKPAEKIAQQRVDIASKEVTDETIISGPVEKSEVQVENRAGTLQSNKLSESGNTIAEDRSHAVESVKNRNTRNTQQSVVHNRSSFNSEKTLIPADNSSLTRIDPVIVEASQTNAEVLINRPALTIRKFNSPVQIESLSADALRLSPFTITPVSFGNGVECYSFNKKRIVPYLEVEGGMGYPIRHMSSNGEPSNLLNNRVETEKPWYSYNVSLNGGLVLRNNMYVATGFNYMVIKEKFDLVKTGVTQIIIDVDPITNQPIDTTIRTGTIKNSGENRYTLLNIPLFLGYQKKMRNWMISAEVGASYNVSLKTSGKILYTDQNVHRLEDIDGLYEKSTGISVNVAMSLHYFINDNFSVYVKPQYVRSLKDWTQPSASIAAGYDILNFNIGLRRTF